MKKLLLSVFSLVIILGMCYSPIQADTPTGDPRAAGLGEAVEAVPEVIDDGSAIDTYIVLLKGDSLASYSGGVAGLRATSPEQTGAVKLDVTSADSVAYLDYLHAEQDAFLASLQPRLGRGADFKFRYDVVLNGFAMELSAADAKSISKMDAVRLVVKDEIRQLETDTSPDFLQVDKIWDYHENVTPGDLETKGEGMLIGVLDTGINLDHPSFAEVGPVDGYVHVNPFGTGVFKGLCFTDATNYICNDKLVGVYGYTTEALIGEDAHAHGSHTASTSAGNLLTADYNGLTVTISGMAPHANIIMYDVCDPNGCANSGSAAAVNQAIADGVDVINYSIGPSSGASDPYADPVELAMLDAMAAGVLTATSAGNSGPEPSTVYKAPAWNIVVANSSHNRSFGVNVIVDVVPTEGDLLELTGVIGTGPVYNPIVGSLKWAGPSYTEGCNTTPFPADYFDGYIALIMRGTCGFAEKVANATTAGADAVVIYNNRQGPAIVMGALEATTIPSVMVDQADGLAAIEYLNVTYSGEVVTIELTEDFVRRINDDWADIIDSQTSRGPYLLHDILEPEVAAPGTNIMAAYNTPGATAPFGQVDVSDEVEINLMSGTSMASPHVAGSALLLMDLFPTWTPMEIKSALVMTADKSTMLKDNGVTSAEIFDVGNGRIDMTKAALTGLVMNETKANFVDADPAEDGDVKTLNIPSYQNSQCVGECSFAREFRNVAGVATEYSVSIEKPAGVEIVVTPSTFTVPIGSIKIFSVEIDVSGAEMGEWQFAYITFETVGTFATGEEISDVRIPLAIMPDAGNLPALVEETVYRDAGGVVLEDLYSIEITEMTFEQAGLTEAAYYDFSLDVDPTLDFPYDDLDDVWYTSFTVPAYTKRLVFEVLETTSTDLDMFMGVGTIPSKASEITMSATGTAYEYISFIDPTEEDPIPVWVLIQNYAGAPGDTIKLAIGILPKVDEGNLEITGPDSVAAGELFDLTLTWDVPAMEPFSAWYGWFSVGTEEGVRVVTKIGETELNIYRPYDDVTKKVSADSADVGDTLTYTITIQPNETGADLAYEIEDVLPAGVTYVPGSLETVGSFNDATYEPGINTIIWSGTMPKIEYTYIVSDNSNNPEYCGLPIGTGVYVDAKTKYGYDPSSGLSGDSIYWQYNTLLANTQYYDTTITGKPVWTDDGYIGMYYPENFEFWDYTNHPFPDVTAPNGIIAPWWRDMEIVYDLATTKGVTAVNYGVAWLVEFDDIEDYFNYASGLNLSMDYEIFAWKELDPTIGWPDIVVAFDNVTSGWDDSDWFGGDEGSVGLENYDASVGSTYAYDDWTPSSGDIVCFDYAVAGAEPVVITFDVIVDSTDQLQITNTVDHEADGLGMEEEQASVTLDVNLTLSDLDLYESLDEVIWNLVPGSFEDGFALLMDPLEEYYYLDVDNIVVNRDLVDGLYPFILDQRALPTGFMPFWDAKGVNASADPASWQGIMYQIITGNEPMFYLKVDGMAYDLIDGLQYIASGGTLEETLRVNGDYPIGEYTFIGQVEDISGLTDDVAVDIEFLAPFELTDLDLLESLDTTTWTTVPGEFTTGFNMILDPVNDYYYLDTANLVVNRPIDDGLYPFFLDQTDLPAGFMAYWDAKGVNAGAASGTWQAVMYQIITGNAPMFLLKVDGMAYDLIDGLQFVASDGTVEEPLRVSGDYPFGTYTFNGEVADEYGYTDDVTVDITFNDKPVAFDQSLETDEDVPLAIVLTATDVWPGNPLTWIVGDPMHGTLTGTAPNLTYTPAADFYGSDSFTFHVNDGFNDSNIATISIEVLPVNDSPVAVDDHYTTPMSTTLSVAAPGVLGNDVDPDPEDLKIAQLHSAPLHGSLQLFGDGSFIYVPDEGYIGQDSFVYNFWSLARGSVIDQAVVYIDVTGHMHYLPLIFK